MAQESGKSFWQNPWVWAGGGCCLGCIVVPILIASLVGGGAFWAVWSSGVGDLKDQALARAQASPAVVEALGEPVEAGFPRNSSVHLTNGEGRAALLLPLSGPKGEGKLQVEAERRENQWEFHTLRFTADASRNEVDLLAGAPPVLEANPE